MVEPSGKFQVSLYKALLFVNIANAIKAGTVCVHGTFIITNDDDHVDPV